jgi:hypothetical protein
MRPATAPGPYTLPFTLVRKTLNLKSAWRRLSSVESSFS